MSPNNTVLKSVLMGVGVIVVGVVLLQLMAGPPGSSSWATKPTTTNGTPATCRLETAINTEIDGITLCRSTADVAIVYVCAVTSTHTPGSIMTDISCHRMSHADGTQTIISPPLVANMPGQPATMVIEKSAVDLPVIADLSPVVTIGAHTLLELRPIEDCTPDTGAATRSTTHGCELPVTPPPFDDDLLNGKRTPINSSENEVFVWACVRAGGHIPPLREGEELHCVDAGPDLDAYLALEPDERIKAMRDEDLAKLSRTVEEEAFIKACAGTLSYRPVGGKMTWTCMEQGN